MVPVLRRQLPPEFAQQLGRAIFNASKPSSIACPSCTRKMLEVCVRDDGELSEFEVCKTCSLVWFDPGELEDLPRRPAPPEEDDGLTPHQRQQFAILSVKERMDRMRREQQDARPQGLQWLPALLGMPVELESGKLRGLPWATWITAALVTLVSVLAFRDAELFAVLALVPEELAYEPFTLLSVFFVHADWLHLVGNLWFLVVFGDNLELHFGRLRWLILLVGATLLGSFLHAIAEPKSSVPCVGASGGISGLIVCYALTMPHARLGMLIMHPFAWLTTRVPWLTFSARAALVGWLLFQLFLAGQQLAGLGSISALAHLGGAIAGAVAWFAWREATP